VLVLKSFALAQSIKYSIVCGVTKEQMLQEDALVYDLMVKQFEAINPKPTEEPSEGAIPSA